MAERVDLDAIEREWVRKYEPAADVVAALVAELRLAREVVKAARKANGAVDLIGTTDYSRAVLVELANALMAYNQATSP